MFYATAHTHSRKKQQLPVAGRDKLIIDFRDRYHQKIDGAFN